MSSAAPVARPQMPAKPQGTIDLSYYSDDCLTEEEKDSFLYLAEIAWKKPTVSEAGMSVNFAEVEAKEPNTFMGLMLSENSDGLLDPHISSGGKSLKKMVSRLQSIESSCVSVLHSLNSILDYLLRLQSTYNEAAQKTGSLHLQCDHLLAEQVGLSDRLEELSSCLRFFADHDRLAARLNSPLVPVSPDTYGAILDRLDQCISFFISSRHFKDGPIFEAKYRELLSRAVANVRNQVTTYVRATASLEGNTNQSLDVLSVSASGEEEEKLGVAYAFLYGRFRLAAFRVRPLVELLESRLDRNPQEYGQAISECHEAYARQREALLSPVVAASVADIVARHGANNASGAGIVNNCALLKAVGAFLRRLCQDEQQLYAAFFTHTTQHVDIMLTDLCSCLTDLFRPRIIHSRHVETLAEMCTTINAELVDSQMTSSNASFETSSLYGYAPSELDGGTDSALSGFDSACRMLLQDIQERLVYASTQYIRDQILNYGPASGDVAYPDKLEMAKSISDQQQQQHQIASANTSTPYPGSPAVAPVNPTAFPAIWYPTVRRTITLLCRLHRCLDRTTLQGICQEALCACIASLHKAAAQIRQNHPATYDSHLFLIKHLLILREQLGPLHIDGVLRETSVALPDVGRRLVAAAKGLVDNRSSILALSSNNALLRFLFESTPDVVERTIDSRQDLDKELRRACDEFITFAVSSVVSQVQEVVEKTTSFHSKQAGAAVQESLKTQPWGNAEHLREVSVELYRNLKVVYPKIREALSLYIANPDTERLLLRPIRTGIEFAVTDFSRIILNPCFTEEDRVIINCPSTEQLSLIFAS